MEIILVVGPRTCSSAAFSFFIICSCFSKSMFLIDNSFWNFFFICFFFIILCLKALHHTQIKLVLVWSDLSVGKKFLYFCLAVISESHSVMASIWVGSELTLMLYGMTAATWNQTVLLIVLPSHHSAFVIFSVLSTFSSYVSGKMALIIDC